MSCDQRFSKERLLSFNTIQLRAQVRHAVNTANVLPSSALESHIPDIHFIRATAENYRPSCGKGRITGRETEGSI